MLVLYSVRIVATADLHGHLPRLPEGDLLIIAGDLCPEGDQSQQAQWIDCEFRDWIGSNDYSEKYQGKRWRNAPYEYHNGGVWPFIGGYYVAALRSVGLSQEAHSELKRLAQANHVALGASEWGFHEWLHGLDGSPGGPPNQSWNAGGFVLAHAAVRQGAAAARGARGQYLPFAFLGKA